MACEVRDSTEVEGGGQLGGGEPLARSELIRYRMECEGCEGL